MPKKICNKPTCNQLIPFNKTYCKEHGTVQTNYSKYNRDKDSAKFYNSTAWRNKRKEIMSNYGGLCQDCLAKDIVKEADVIDHKIELKDDESLALNNDNLIPLCHACHNIKTKQTKQQRVTPVSLI